MPENARADRDAGAGEPKPARRGLSLEAQLERQEAEIAASGPTMDEWLAHMNALDWGTVDSDSMIQDIREWRDRAAG